MLDNNIYTGKWVSDAGSGDFAFTFAADFSTATGWWSEGDDSPKQIQFLRCDNRDQVIGRGDVKYQATD